MLSTMIERISWILYKRNFKNKHKNSEKNRDTYITHNGCIFSYNIKGKCIQKYSNFYQKFPFCFFFLYSFVCLFLFVHNSFFLEKRKVSLDPNQQTRDSEFLSSIFLNYIFSIKRSGIFVVIFVILFILSFDSLKALWWEY